MKVFKIVFGFLILILSTWIFVYFARGGQVSLLDFATSASKLEVVKREEVKENISNIDILLQSGAVRIFKSDKDYIEIIQKASGDLEKKKLFLVNIKGDSLVIESDKNAQNIPSHLKEHSIIEVYLPDKEYNSFYIDCLSGVLESDFLKVKKFTGKLSSGVIRLDGNFSDADIEVKSGTLKSANLSCDNLKAQVSSGNMKLNGNFKNLDLSASSGNIHTNSGTKLDSFNCNVVSGNVILLIPADSVFTIGASGTSGNIQNGFKNDTYNGSEKRAIFNIIANSGNVKILKR